MKNMLIFGVLLCVCGLGHVWAGAGSAGHAGHETSKNAPVHDGHGTEATSKAELIMRTDPAVVQPGMPVLLTFYLKDAHGNVLKDFDIVHEKKVHLILIRKGLDTFTHLHPEVTVSGQVSTKHVFILPGTYHVYADYKLQGEDVVTSMVSLVVTGKDTPAQALMVNVPGKVLTADMLADISVEKQGDVRRIRFDLADVKGTKVTDLEPYLGAMGHLVVVSADGSQYVHAHPVPGSGNVVAFDAHFPGSGVYKAWGQFQRKGIVHDVPFVLEIR